MSLNSLWFQVTKCYVLRRDSRDLLKQTCSTSRYLGRMNGLFLVERLVNQYGATFTYLELPLGQLKSIELERNCVDPARHLDASRCELSCGSSVHDDFRALWNRVHLRPCDAACGFFTQRHVEQRLNIVLDLNASRVGLVTLQPQDQVVLAWCERQCYGRLT